MHGRPKTLRSELPSAETIRFKLRHYPGPITLREIPKAEVTVSQHLFTAALLTCEGQVNVLAENGRVAGLL